MADDIVLRETSTTRLIFRPTLIGTNPKNPEALAKGSFIFQKKGPKDEWVNVSGETLASLKSGEIRKLDLHSEELLKLIKSIEGLYELVREQGIRMGRSAWVSESALLQGLIRSDDFLETVLDSREVGLVSRVVAALARMPRSAVEQLQTLTPQELTNVSAIVGAARLSTFLGMYRGNRSNSSERFWHQALRENAWVISQIFAAPMVIFQDESYFGGKSISNKGGKLADFAYRNKLTKNLAIVEIKTPLADLVDARHYRDGVYGPSRGTTGGITQLLIQKATLMEELATLQKNARLSGEEEFEAYSPRVVLITGSLERESLDTVRLRSFELFRNELRDVELITFDELAQKVSDLLELLTATSTEDSL